jgi:hypothetical protein
LRDPRQINLRYEAPAVTEYFIASLLAPVGATPLSQNVSAQEYSRLFDRDHIGIASSTEYFSSGDWIQRGSQYGTFGNTDWSLDAYYRTENGQRKNNDVERQEYTARIKQEITRADTLYAEVQINRFESGDVAQYYNQGGKVPGVVAPSTTLRVKEVQEPNVFLGYHREWAPGITRSRSRGDSMTGSTCVILEERSSRSIDPRMEACRRSVAVMLAQPTAAIWSATLRNCSRFLR